MTFDDGLGTYLHIWSDGIWVYINMSMSVETLLIAILMYLLAGWGIYRWRKGMTPEPMSTARLLAIRIGKIVNIGPDTHMMMFGELESLIQAGLTQAICPECRTKSIAQYQDKYGIVPEEWTQEQCLEAMKSIHYDRMELEWKIKEAKKEAYEQGLEVGNAKLKENFKHWTDVAMKEAYEDAAKIVFEHTFDCSKIGTSVNLLIEKLREKVNQ